MLEGIGKFEDDVGGKAEAGVTLAGLSKGMSSDACISH